MKSQHSRTKPVIFDAFTFSYLLFATFMSFSQFSDDTITSKMTAFVMSFAALAVVGIFVSLLVRKVLKKTTLGDMIFTAPHARFASGGLISSIWGWQLLLLLGITFWVGIHQTRFSFTELTDSDGFAGAIRLFIGSFDETTGAVVQKGLLQPNLKLLPLAIIKIVETIFIAFMATTLAIPVAFVLGFFSAKNIMGGSKLGLTVYVSLRTLFNVMRSVEALIWAIIFSVWVGIGPFAGMMALWIHSIASLAKQYSELTEGVSDGPIEGIRSTGAGFLQTIWFAIVPQVVLPYVAFTIYRWDINVRMATIIGLVGGGGIGTMLIQYQGQAMWSEVGCIILVIAIVVWVMDAASAYLREALK